MISIQLWALIKDSPFVYPIRCERKLTALERRTGKETVTAFKATSGFGVEGIVEDRHGASPFRTWKRQDGLRLDARETVKELSAIGVEIAILFGGLEEPTRRLAKELGIADFRPAPGLIKTLIDLKTFDGYYIGHLRP